MSHPLAGVEFVFGLAILKDHLDYKTLTLVNDDTTIDLEGRELFVESRNNEWLVFPEDFTWEATFFLDEFKWGDGMQSSIRMNAIDVTGDLRAYQHDMMLTKMIHGELLPNLSVEEGKDEEIQA